MCSIELAVRPNSEVIVVAGLFAAGLSDSEISQRTEIPRRTISGWRHGGRRFVEVCAEMRPTLQQRCAYAYLLGMYLGDGCISATHRPGVWRLRIFSDAKYPEIISECCRAMEAMFPGKRAHRLRRKDCACIEVSMYSKRWLELFPQHGQGPKHRRRIELDDWQRAIVAVDARALVRGLIHSDGCRIVAVERQSGRVRRAPRYVFSNVSEDIKTIFCEACDALGVRWTRPNDKSIAVYRLQSVALLDEFIGPKR